MKTFVIEREIPAPASSPSKSSWHHQHVQRRGGVAEQAVPVAAQLRAGDKIYCVHQAEDADVIREHAKTGGFPANLVAEVTTCSTVRARATCRADLSDGSRPRSPALPAASVRVLQRELREDVAHMHVDGAGAEHQLFGNLAVRVTRRDQPHDLKLPAREAPVIVDCGRAPAQALFDDSPRRSTSRQRATRGGGAEIGGDRMGLREVLERRNRVSPPCRGRCRRAARSGPARTGCRGSRAGRRRARSVGRHLGLSVGE